MKRTISCLLSIYTGLLSKEAEVIIKWISGADFVAEYDTIASADEKDSYYKPVVVLVEWVTVMGYDIANIFEFTIVILIFMLLLGQFNNLTL